MTTQNSQLHIETPIADAEEIPYEREQMGPGSVVLQIRFERDEIDRLRTRSPQGPLIRFIKQAALEKADAEAQRRADQTVDGSVEAAD